MERDMLEQIQQMIVTANESLRQHLGQDIAAVEFRLGERIEEAKRHTGILVEDLHHKLDQVIEGQQFLGQRITDIQSDMTSQNHETRVLFQLSYKDLDGRVSRLEQRDQP